MSCACLLLPARWRHAAAGCAEAFWGASSACSQTSDYDTIKSHLEIGRYVFLVFILIEIVALAVTVVVRVRNPYEADADSFEEQQAARSAMAQIQMEGLKHSMQRTASKSPAVGAPDGNFYTASSKMMKRCGGTPALCGGHALVGAGCRRCRAEFALNRCVLLFAACQRR